MGAPQSPESPPELVPATVGADHLVEGDKVSFNIASAPRTGKPRAATVTVIQ